MEKCANRYSLPNIATYGVRLCQEETCGESVIPAAMVGEEMEVDLHGIAGILRLEQCQQYQLYILPDTRMGRGRQEDDNWHAGHESVFTYIPGYDKPRIPADNGDEGDVDKIVMFVTTDSVDLEWRPPNKCVEGHDVQVVAISHLPHLAGELSEDVVFHQQVNQS